MELFGAWSIIRQILNYLNLADLRPFTGLKLTLALQQHVTDPEPKRRQIGASLVIWVITLPLMVGLACGLLYFSELLVPVQATHRLAVRWALTIALFGSIAATLFALPNNVLRGVNLDYKAMGLQAFLSVIFGLSCVLVVMAGWGLPGLAFAALLTPLVAGLVQLALARRYVPWFGVSMPQKSDLRDCAKINGWLLLDSALSVLVFSQDLILAGCFLSIEDAAKLGLISTACRIIFELLSQVLTSGSAGLSGLFGKGETTAIVRLRRELISLALGSIAVFGSAYLILNNTFLKIWINESDRVHQFSFVPILVIQSCNFIYRIERVWPVLALDFKITTIANLILFPVSIVASFLGAHLYGFQGFLWGLAISRLFLVVGLMWTNNRRLGERTKQLVGHISRSFVALLVMLWISIWSIPALSVETWAAAIIVAVIIITGASLTWIVVGLDETGRANLFKRAGLTRYI